MLTSSLTVAAGRTGNPIHERERVRFSLLLRLADALVSEMEANGGLIRHDDLVRYRPQAGEIVELVRIRQPLPSQPSLAGTEWVLEDLCGTGVLDNVAATLSFDEAGRVTHFGLPAGELEDIIRSGLPFRTSGCPGKVQDDISACDRPYGDSPPSDIASYPFQPDKKDLKKIRKQLGIPNRLV